MIRKSLKKLKGLFRYLIGGYTTLSNWSSFVGDLIRIQFGSKTKSTIYKLRDGTNINVHPNSEGLNLVFYEVFLKSEYDGMEKFKINKDDIVIDIGAHLGFFTIKASKKATKGKVYAFEPFSMHYKLLKQNIEQNSIANVKYYNEAISDKTGELSFFYTMENDPGDTSLFQINSTAANYEEKIKSTTLNDFFQKENLDVCNFMKLDCEGAEYSILMSADKSVLNKIQKIAMEWHRFDSEQDPKKLANFLHENGFTLIEPENYDGKSGFLYAFR